MAFPSFPIIGSRKESVHYHLEYGHAKRNGGRVEGKAHIAPAEQQGIQQLQEEIERALRG